MSQPISDTIITTFLKAYEPGGIANKAIKAVRELHDLSHYPQKGELPDWLMKHYTATLPKQVQEQTEAFDFSPIENGRISPIIAEVDSNIMSMVGDDRERYIFGLLTPFADLADILHPKAAINRLQAEITNHNKALAMWESKPQNEQLFNINGEASGTPKEQAEACKWFINRCERDIERLSDIGGRFCEIVSQASESGTIEYYCGVWVSAALQFANRLDALLLTYGVDLMQLQEASGIYLKDHRVITDVEYYIGSIELARHYINSLPPRQHATLTATPKEPSTEAGQLPKEIDTAEAKGYFSRAVEAGLMSKQFKWLASQALLACFCREMSVKLDLGKGYNSEGQKRLRWKPFELLFGIKKGALRASYNDIQKTGQDPIGIEKVNQIFED